jgi:hypothetical protein
MKEILLAIIVAVGMGFAAATLLESGQQDVQTRFSSPTGVSLR